MRKIKEPQMELGAKSVGDIKIDKRSRDEIPKLLMGLQYIYCTKGIREEVFGILEEMLLGVDKKKGRRGMDLWNILVLGTLRLNCNWDYDKLQEIANNHHTLRQMLGHGEMDEEKKYALQTLKDNVSLLTPEILDKINQVVVKAGHNLVGKKKEEGLKVRCDSFVVETNVHYPTDINILFDAMRKVITLIAGLCNGLGIAGWRQNEHNIRKIKRAFRRVQNLKHSTSKKEEKIAKREKEITKAHEEYIKLSESFLIKTERGIEEIREKGSWIEIETAIKEIEGYKKDARQQIEQIRRRVIKKEIIPHNEKLFSIFERETEWICKGKAGILQELGKRVCIVEDEYKFILYHLVMEKQTDDKVSVIMIEGAKERFSEVDTSSFDKGFYTPDNRIRLNAILKSLIMPKKGSLSATDKEIENTEEFISGKKQHSAVESAINALENHGLDYCPDHGITGFKRYVALSILARNIQILGDIIQKKAAKRERRIKKAKFLQAREVLKKAA